MKMHVAAVLCLPTLLAGAQTRHFTADDLTKIVRISDPQVSPDGRTVAFVVGRANLKEDRWDSELDLVDVATQRVRAVTHDRLGVGMPRWSPSGDRLAYLAQDANKHGQIFVLPLEGGDSVQITHQKTSVSGLAWRPDGQALAFGAADEEPEKKDEAKFEDAFEVGNNDVLERQRNLPVHLWQVTLPTGEAKRVTSGTWSIPNRLPGAPAQLAYTPDGSQILFVRAGTPLTGDTPTSRLMLVPAAGGAAPKAITQAAIEEDNPVLSPDGTQVMYLSPRGGRRENDTSLYIAPIAGGPGTDAALALDRSIAGAAWLPDSHSALVVATDRTHGAMWMQPVGGAARRLELGGLNPSPGVNVGKSGVVAFTPPPPTTLPSSSSCRTPATRPCS